MVIQLSRKGAGKEPSEGEKGVWDSSSLGYEDREISYDWKVISGRMWSIDLGWWLNC